VVTAVRQQIILAVDIAVESGARLFKACEAIHLDQRRLRRWRNVNGDGRKGGYRAGNQRISETEKDAIVHEFAQPWMADLPIKVAHATLMDKGIYLASPSTFVRVLRERNIRKPRASKATNVKRPLLVATAPGQVWCWDITWLEAPIKGTYFYLYMIIDMYSRKVVGWDVFAKEDGTLARVLFAQALVAEHIPAGQITVHSDNGKPMRSTSLRSLFDMLSVTASYGRPHTSNDNAYAESLFATFKGRVAFPEYFSSIESASAYCLEFFTWYNCFHMHSGLDFVTPQTVHNGLEAKVFEHRNMLMETNRNTHPSRHGGNKRIFGIPSEVRLKHRTIMNKQEK
jgi:putative transposase